jgi:hypothetical protein
MSMSSPGDALLRCLVCCQPFDFEAHEAAVVLRHVAYGHDFAHDGPCLAAARERLFPEPGYDCAAFGRDPERRRVLGAATAAGWAAVLPTAPERLATGPAVRLEPLRCWVLVEHTDGARRMEGLVRDEEWLHEPGGAEFPEARRGQRALIGYAPTTDRADAAGLAAWAPSPGRLTGRSGCVKPFCSHAPSDAIACGGA